MSASVDVRAATRGRTRHLVGSNKPTGRLYGTTSIMREVSLAWLAVAVSAEVLARLRYRRVGAVVVALIHLPRRLLISRALAPVILGLALLTMVGGLYATVAVAPTLGAGWLPLVVGLGLMFVLFRQSGSNIKGLETMPILDAVGSAKWHADRTEVQ